MSENKEELEKKSTYEVNTQEEVLEKKAQEPKQEDVKEEQSKIEENKVQDDVSTKTQEQEEVVKDSEEYYDELDYQEKDQAEKVKAKTRSILREILDWVLCFVLAYIVYLNINYFIGSVAGVKQQSMYPTVVDGERVLVVRPWLTFSDLEYGDIVTFEAPIDHKLYIDSADTYPIAQYEQYTGLTQFLYKFMNVNKVNYIKRVIGVAGDHIQIKDGAVYRNGEKLDEPYIRTSVTSPQEEEYSDVVVPEGTVYLMGDNRDSSLDSRTFGCVPLDRVNGCVLCRVWPLNKIGGID